MHKALLLRAFHCTHLLSILCYVASMEAKKAPNNGLKSSTTGENSPARSETQQIQVILPAGQFATWSGSGVCAYVVCNKLALQYCISAGDDAAPNAIQHLNAQT